MRHLMFQIAAPMMSWGNELARAERPTDGHPRKSAILGLLGAALGKPRNDPWHARIQEALGFATIVIRPGVRIMDYHTVATPEGPRRYDTRKEEAAASDYTVQTLREYLCDAYFAIALWQVPDGPGTELEDLAHGLTYPVWEIFAGRKSCPLSLPTAPKIADVNSLKMAFSAYVNTLFEPLVPDAREFAAYWEDHPASGLQATGTSPRNDALVNRVKKLFRSRNENQGSLIL